MDGIICEFWGHYYMLPILIMNYFSGCSSSLFLARLLWRVHLAADDKLWFSFIAHPAGQIVTNCDKLIQNNETPKLFFFSIRPSYILIIDQPIDLISDILDKSLWVGTATPSTIFQTFFIFSWLVFKVLFYKRNTKVKKYLDI